MHYLMHARPRPNLAPIIITLFCRADADTAALRRTLLSAVLSAVLSFVLSVAPTTVLPFLDGHQEA